MLSPPCQLKSSHTALFTVPQTKEKSSHLRAFALALSLPGFFFPPKYPNGSITLLFQVFLKLSLSQ